jgi:ATP-binding cassette subfamily B protein
LRNLNVTVEPGEHVAIVGASGAGKSTLIGLLLGWHRLSAGKLCVDGVPMTGDAREALRRSTAWVDPAVQIWNRSFADNIGYGSEDGALARIGDAVDAASLKSVLRNLPDGMQTKLGEGGALVSGGEGQRVRLGRAFAQRGVRLALLDEPFRGLDRDRRSALLATARKRWHGATMLCVTHDVGETQLFDRVLVIEDGRIVEDDHPARLAAAPSRYQELLEAEREVLGRLWDGGDWRRVVIRDGRAHESG